MPDWVAAHIYIGGEVKKSQLPGLLKAIRDEGCDFEWNGDTDTNFTKASDILDNLDDQGHLHLGSGNAAEGMFETLEKFLRDNQIAYNRYGDGLSGSWDAVVNFYRKGYKEDIDLVVANNGDPVIAASVAIEAFNALKVGNVHAALEALAPYQKYVVPELPPFQLVDGVP
jgi:hypothetical protein